MYGSWPAEPLWVLPTLLTTIRKTVLDGMAYGTLAERVAALRLLVFRVVSRLSGTDDGRGTGRTLPA